MDLYLHPKLAMAFSWSETGQLLLLVVQAGEPFLLCCFIFWTVWLLFNEIMFLLVIKLQKKSHLLSFTEIEGMLNAPVGYCFNILVLYLWYFWRHIKHLWIFICLLCVYGCVIRMVLPEKCIIQQTLVQITWRRLSESISLVNSVLSRILN